MGLNDTIAAVSTPRGKGGIAVIRISGNATRDIASRVFKSGSNNVKDYPARSALYGSITTPAGERLDSGILVMYDGPSSYTGEDMAEISCHGGTYVTAAVLGAVLEAGAESAGPGEFTRRAFTNGKLSLTEAEAVGLLIDADTEEKMKLSAAAVGGKLKDEIKKVSDKLSFIMSALYAAIDYPDEDIGDEGETAIGKTISEVKKKIKSLIATYKRGRAVADGVKCVICGKPNAGKSSLYNIISRSDDAIVTDVAGTTRDVLRDTVSFGGITLRLSDTAGLRSASDKVEKIGVERAKAEIASAELIISVFDSTEKIGDDAKKMIKEYERAAKIAAVNKTDAGELDSDDVAFLEKTHDKVVYISCATGDGIASLEDAVRELFDGGKIDLSSDAVVWDARQKASLSAAASLLDEAETALDSGAYLDAVGAVCEKALEKLLETDGRGVTEEIVNNIFARFCVGK